MQVQLILVAIVLAVSAEENVELFANFKRKHGKSYSLLENELRFQIFQENLNKIEEHNALYEKGEVSWKMGLNQFADLTAEEFAALTPKWNTDIMNRTRAQNPNKLILVEDVAVPSSFDWREKGAVTNVKSQESCGGCWSFSATGALESHQFIKTGKLVSLSEQNLLDCAGRAYGNAGCNGGVMDYAFDYVKDNGIESEEDYPYEARDGTCRYSKSKSVLSGKGYVDIYNNENKLLQVVATIGPVSISVDADYFQFYSSGVFNAPQCTTDVDHGILIVGYGEENGIKYWIVKNSWSADFGEKGYIRMQRGINQCGLAMWPVYPLL
ncbi:procathepsin L-like [Cylas formicarius]|uniref:procathepsin L-like n=1 Tax=Cylas formicarius TaxID=197179 RepID=UPI002958C011|nr:procathepsin L-like [Cylas formicarius]